MALARGRCGAITSCCWPGSCSRGWARMGWRGRWAPGAPGGAAGGHRCSCWRPTAWPRRRATCKSPRPNGCPWTLLFAERALRAGRRRDAALAGLCFGLTALTAWYYALIGGLLLAGYVVLRLWQMRRDVPLAAGARRARCSGWSAGVLVLPGLVPALRRGGRGPTQPLGQSRRRKLGQPGGLRDPQRVAAALGPAGDGRRTRDQNIIERRALSWACSRRCWPGVALWRARRRRAGAWIWAALVARLLRPVAGADPAHRGGRAATMGGATVPLPGAAAL